MSTTITFADLGLNPSILKALADKGYARPTPVQEKTIPLALTGTDLLVSSQTGSGKTAAFMLPCLHRLGEPSPVRGIGPRVLVLTPTRELALQVQNAASTYGRELRRLRCATIVGGASYTTQLRLLSKPVDVVVATPGRLIDHRLDDRHVGLPDLLVGDPLGAVPLHHHRGGHAHVVGAAGRQRQHEPLESQRLDLLVVDRQVLQPPAHLLTGQGLLAVLFLLSLIHI